MTTQPAHPDRDADPAGLGRSTYVAPTVETLGTLAELTRGGVVGPGDGFGSAGSSGSI